jgi:hypothetical protein
LGKIFLAVTYLPYIIQAVEAIFGAKKGQEKATAAIDLVYRGLGFAEFITTREIVDEDLFREGLKQANDGVVKMLNASVWRKTP